MDRQRRDDTFVVTRRRRRRAKEEREKTAKSNKSNRGGEVTVTIAAGKIRGCDFVTWQKDGTVKDGDYGKINGEILNRDYYDKAQLAVRAMRKYAAGYPGPAV
jgi:major membrane immunogen (membrane-anchored lipoprotein)